MRLLSTAFKTMCTDDKRCPLGNPIRNVTLEFYSDDRNVTEQHVLGVMIAAHFQWDGLKILQTAADALEDANFHDECEAVLDLLHQVKQTRKLNN